MSIFLGGIDYNTKPIDRNYYLLHGKRHKKTDSMTITENKESLEVIRFKCTKRQTDFNAEELRHLNLVYMEINEKIGKQKKRPLDQSCGSCVITAMNVVYNYIVYHEASEDGFRGYSIKANGFESKNKAIVSEVIDKHKIQAPEIIDIKIQAKAQPTLKELRQQHPHIKATSVEVFLQKLNENT